MMKFKYLGYFVAMILIFTACKEDCNDIYRIHTVEVRADSLQEAYTVRTQTADTLNRYTEIAGDTNRFMLVGDEFQDRLSENGEPFLFHLRTPDSLYQYTYLFEDGECHVEKLSGHDRITL